MPSEMTTESVEALAAGLAGHEADVSPYDAASIYGCRCGWTLTTEQKHVDDYGWSAYRIHVVEALIASGAVLLAQDVRHEALRELAKKWQWNEWTTLTAQFKKQSLIGTAQVVTDWLWHYANKEKREDV